MDDPSGNLDSGVEDPAVVGEWSPLQLWPIGPTHTSVVPSGDVMFFGEFSFGDNHYMWNPDTGRFTELQYAGYNIFCAGHSFLADGRLLVTGGHVASHVGFKNTIIFDPESQTWTRTPEMNDPRWYPTNTTLSNGDVLVISGETTAAGVMAETPQVYEVATDSWRDLTGARVKLPYYPRQFLAPNGMVFIAGPQPWSYYLDTGGTGSMTRVAQPNVSGRTYGPAVMYDVGKILMVGGNQPPTAAAEVIDLNVSSPRWRAVASMGTPRRQHNATVLPDGTVLVTGGSYGNSFDDKTSPVFTTELWNPVTERWTTLANVGIYRGYHSTAVLLRDGRVLVGGSRNDNTAQIYSPPYLFKGPRPTIASVETDVEANSQLSIQTPDAASIRRVALIRLGSVTHAFDQNARYVPLSFAANPGGIVADVPNYNVTPPGHYMLFLVNDQGVPSVATTVRVGPPALAPQRIRLLTPESGESLTPGAAYRVTWTAPSTTPRVNLDYSTDVGATWTKLIHSIVNRGYYDWTVPSTPASAMLLRLSDSANPALFGVSPGPFAIGGPVARMFFTAPTVGTTIPGGTDFSFAWTSPPGVPRVNYDYSIDHGAIWRKISYNNVNRSTYTWRVPDMNVDGVLMRVSSTNEPSIFGESPAFRVTGGPFAVGTPAAGVTLTAGSSYDITWTAPGSIPRVDLKYSADAGGIWKTISGKIVNSGRFTWTVFNLDSATVQVKVVDSADETQFAVSGMFTVRRP
ncbi:galactose oxidase-like domain-containing protein [Vulgatibacter incomptus]|uniref:galactose oxidase-like domain-containing protein n=1 Tax=Vulgatibacter incomptus TaxID=1391653 RepID=UPI0014700E7D|nr:galactose oxidase-like domain-containing protein [Vulgatibacter incomptus]